MTSQRQCGTDSIVGRVVDVRRVSSATSMTVDMGRGSLIRFMSRDEPSVSHGELVAVQRLDKNERPNVTECKSVSTLGSAFVLCSSRRLGLTDDVADQIYVIRDRRSRVGDVFMAGAHAKHNAPEMLIISAIPDGSIFEDCG